MEFEREHREWTVDDTVQWILMIEKAHFRASKYTAFIQKLREMGIDGAQLVELNNKFALNVAGLTADNEQYILRKHINRIVDCKSGAEYQNICGICVKNKVSTAMVPCGHQYHCSECVGKGRVRKCPICRKPVTQIIKTFMSGFSK